METIIITVNVNGSSVSREFDKEFMEDIESGTWGKVVAEMLDTIEKSKVEKF